MPYDGVVYIVVNVFQRRFSLLRRLTRKRMAPMVLLRMLIETNLLKYCDVIEFDHYHHLLNRTNFV